MAKIHPFRAIRPIRDKVHLVAARPSYSYKQNVLEAKLEDNPFTFLHIINPEFGNEATTKGNTLGRFELVSKRYSEFIEKGILIQDEAPISIHLSTNKTWTCFHRSCLWCKRG